MHFYTATTLKGKGRSMRWYNNKIKGEVCGSGDSEL